MRGAVCAALALGLATASAAAQEQQVAVLQGLDKITAKVRAIEAPVDVQVEFGALSIVVRACRKRPPEEPPEVTAFLEIDERPRGEASQRLFAGWMFASSPALNALEHPVYDVWVTDCRAAAPERPAGRR